MTSQVHLNVLVRATPGRQDCSISRLWRPPLAVFLVACLVRVAAVAWLPGFHDDPSTQGDARDYHQLAVNLTEGRGYVLPWPGGGPEQGELHATAQRAPAWPVALAGLYTVTGPSPWAGRVLLIVLDSVTCGLLAVLGARLVSRRVGTLAGLFAALYPPLWVNVFRLHAEVLFTLLVVLALLVAERIRRGPTPGRALQLAALLGLAALTRPNGILVAIAVAGWLVWWCWRHLERQVALLVAGTCVVGMFVVVQPWVAYSSARLGVLTPVTSQGGPVLAGYYSPRLLDYDTVHWGSWDVDRVGDILKASPDETTYYLDGQKAGLSFIRHNPGDAARILAMHVVRYFDLYWDQDGRLPLLWFPSIWPEANVAAVVGWWIAGVLAVVGVSRCRRRLGPWLPALAVFLALAASGVLLGATPRLRSPSDPIVLLFAAAGVVGLAETIAVLVRGTVRAPSSGLSPSSGSAR